MSTKSTCVCRSIEKSPVTQATVVVCVCVSTDVRAFCYSPGSSSRGAQPMRILDAAHLWACVAAAIAGCEQRAHAVP
eukprot:4714742-Alexandrium_andersonii.AAC.1